MKLKLTAISLVGFATLSFAIFASAFDHGPNAREPADSIALIANYKRWTRVNATPVKMEPAVAALCAAASVKPNPIRDSIHRDAFITVFVNDTGRQAMLSTTPQTFPVGSVIVKQKLETVASRVPVLLTVMVKREPGFDAANGDWEYFVTEGSGKKRLETRTSESCQSCHESVRSADYVFRTYLNKN